VSAHDADGRGWPAAALAAGLVCLGGGASACSSPDYLQVALVGGEAEVVTDPAGIRVEGSFDLELYLPSGGQTTDFLLLRMTGRYDHGLSCPRGVAELELSSPFSFPLQLEPATTITATVDFVDAHAALASSCAPVEQLALSGHYYDSVVDAHEGRAGTEITGALPVDPGAAGGPNDWTCVGQLQPPTFIPGTSTGTIWVRQRASGNVVPGTTVRICAQQDPACDSPFDEGVTDIVGYWPLLVPTSEPFFFEVSGSPAIVPALFYEFAPPAQPDFERTLAALSTSTLNEAASALGVTPAPSRGHVVVVARDCGGAPAAGVRFALDPTDGAATIGYWRDGVVAPELAETGADGLALLVNVPAMSTSVTARLTATDEEISSRLVNVRAGTTTVVSVEPWPQGP